MWVDAMEHSPSVVVAADPRILYPKTRVQDKADPTKITNTQRIDGALPTIKKGSPAQQRRRSM